PLSGRRWRGEVRSGIFRGVAGVKGTGSRPLRRRPLSPAAGRPPLTRTVASAHAPTCSAFASAPTGLPGTGLRAVAPPSAGRTAPPGRLRLLREGSPATAGVLLPALPRPEEAGGQPAPGQQGRPAQRGRQRARGRRRQARAVLAAAGRPPPGRSRHAAVRAAAPRTGRRPGPLGRDGGALA